MTVRGEKGEGRMNIVTITIIIIVDVVILVHTQDYVKFTLPLGGPRF